MARLTEKQRKFVEAYMGDAEGNATEAARLAGYSGDEDALAVRGAENVRKRKIREAIRERQQKDPLVASRKERQSFWTAVMRGEEGDPDTKDRLTAAKMLGKSQGDFVERHEHEHSGPNGDAITINVVNSADGN